MKRSTVSGTGKPDHKDGVDLTGDGGIRKIILKPGLGGLIPKGMTAIVHYTGKLENGEVFDSSVERKKPFQFKLGNNDVILGWDKGVATMGKGEICLLTIKPDYGYGRTAVGPIPANSTLYFEIELLGWNEGAPGLDTYLNWAIYALTTVVICMAALIYLRRHGVL